MNWGKWTDEDELYLYLDSVNYTEYIPDDFNKFVLDRINDDSIPVKILADLPDNDIHIAHTPPFGAVLSVKSEKYFYPWNFSNVARNMVRPRLSLIDYDGDGIDELAVIHNIGSGTQYYVEELHIIELDEHMTTTAVTYETIKDLLSQRLSAYFDPTEEEIIVKLDDQIVSGGYLSPNDRKMFGDFQRLDLESIISFNADSDALTVDLSIGLVTSAPSYNHIKFYADVIYDGSSLSLSNCRIAPYE